MTGKEAIIEKIKADARQKANSTLEEGAKKAQEAISIARSDAKIYKDKHMEESYIEREEIINRKITVANLEVKKLLLQAKKEIIDRAFEEAVNEIKKDEKAYLALIKRMLAYCEDDDTVIISESDKNRISKTFVVKTANEYGKRINVSENYGTFKGGIILSGKGSDKNLTLDVELSVVKEEYEPQIAEILFGE